MYKYKIIIHAYSLDELADISPVVYGFQQIASLLAALKFFEMAKQFNIGFIPIDGVETYISALGITEINIGPTSLSTRTEIINLFEKLIRSMGDIVILSPSAGETQRTQKEIDETQFFNDAVDAY